ncbi:hypothetical protein ACFQ26_13445, partial [Roseovarius aestuarii]
LNCYSNVASHKLVYGNPLRSIVNTSIEPLLSFFFRTSASAKPKRKHTNNGMLSPVDFEIRQHKINQAGV